MFSVLLFSHSLFRWFVLCSLLYAVYRSYRGYIHNLPFGKTDNLIRHLTATVAHVQLMLGIIVYSKSDTVKSLFRGIAHTDHITEPVFFGAIHIAMMMLAIIVITFGSVAAKRQSADHEKFRTILICYSIALALIFMAIPWPFSPFAQRPYLRSF